MKKTLISEQNFRNVLMAKQDLIWVTEKAMIRYRHLLPSDMRVVKTPKELLFPGWEMVYRYFFKDRNWKVQEVEEKPSSSVLFLLPCEAKAVVEVLDVNFLQRDYVDTSYARRRSHVQLVILGCTAQEETCFCHLVGGSPLWRDAQSVFVLPREGELYVENDEQHFFGQGKELSEKEEEKLLLEEQRIKEQLPPPLPPDFPQRLYTLFEEEEWRDITWRCINCGACTFLCPTCYCFDLSVDGKLRGAMLRTWDSCMFPKFTLHASSHNPRPTGKERVRQRVMHKFSYFPLREKYYGCVGCGICREVCPVNWDIKEAVERMVKRIESSCSARRA